ncbi:MAG TPA: hypothetical protein VLI67_09975 [Vicinamibacteria bacterium]|nr:hypothetical protein [Vicinamibacteria bacterium]
MADDPDTPFDSIEGALEYVGLLREALEEARGSIEEDVALARGEGATRRLEALQIVAYKLDRLSHHVGASHRLLNDLRSLRRLLMGERGAARPAVSEAEPVESLETEGDLGG